MPLAATGTPEINTYTAYAIYENGDKDEYTGPPLGQARPKDRGLEARSMSPGQIAYEEDVRRKPHYHPREDGTVVPRLPWAQLGAMEKWSWEKNPTPRSW